LTIGLLRGPIVFAGGERARVDWISLSGLYFNRYFGLVCCSVEAIDAATI
jgi:hypothetical protein